jgi:Glycosyl hydrolase family 26
VISRPAFVISRPAATRKASTTQPKSVVTPAPRQGRARLFVSLLAVLVLCVVTSQPAPGLATAGTRTFTAVADAFVTSTQPRTNFGRSRELRVDRSPVTRAYVTFRWRVPAGQGTRALLRIYSKTSLRRGFAVRSVSRGWRERTIVFVNAPPVSPVRARLRRIRAGRWRTTDVTSLVRGRDVLRVALTTSSSTAIRLGSRESARRPRLSLYPASYFTGPAGKRNIVPPRRGALLGIYPGGRSRTWAQLRRQFLSRERYVGRKLDIMGLHYGAPPGGCYYPGYAPFSVGHEAWVARHGAIPYVSWSPRFSLDQINAGQADACLRNVARRARAYGRRVFWRMYWEFNGSWYSWSGTGQRFIDAWRRTVSIFRAERATNLVWVWSPDEGWYNANMTPSYPGDSYVDWVASDGYNWNAPDAWCWRHPGWCWFGEIFHAGPTPGESVETDFRHRKPYMVGETGSVEDPNVPGRKGAWFRNARDQIKASFPGLMAFVYFDQNPSAVEGCTCNWRIDSSWSSLRGFRALARDAHFRTRG